MWGKLMQSSYSAVHLEEIQKAWRNTAREIILEKRGWSAVRGPLGATIATLNDLEWKPIAPHFWRNPEDTEEAVLSPPRTLKKSATL